MRFSASNVRARYSEEYRPPLLSLPYTFPFLPQIAGFCCYSLVPPLLVLRCLSVVMEQLSLSVPFVSLIRIDRERVF